jgi:apolipoprotein N-acyltransferase
LAFGVAISATDIVRTYILTGFPWAAIGHVWIDTPVAQAAAWVGAGGLSLLAGLAATLPLLTEGPRGRLVLGGLSLAVIGALWLAGAARLAAPQAPRDPAIHVRLVQPNATQALKWQEGMWQVFLERLFAQTEAPPAPGTPRPDLIVWPETSVPVLLENAGPLLDDLVTAAQGASVTLGIQRAEGARFYNSLVVMDREGAVTHIYDKHHLTPFGEYIPLGDFAARFGISAFAAQAGNGYSAGPGPAVLDLGPLGRVLPLICYEAIFPQGLRTNDRPDWILMITNDAWFGNLAGPYQHLAQVRLRAIEQGLPVLRSANTGVSAVIDAKGRNLASTALNTEGFLDAPVPAALPATPYARWGDLPATILVLLALLALIVPRRRAPD